MSGLDPLLGALTPERWATANRELTAKLLTELAYEELLAPEPVAPLPDDPPLGHEHGFRLALGERLTVGFRARRRSLGVWRVDPASLDYALDGAPLAELDAVDLVALGAPAIGASAETTAGLVQELSNTVLADVWGAAVARPAAELVDLPADELEGEMRGHPWIVANKGRMGFDGHDLLAYAPESQPRLALPWLAVRAERAQTAALDGLDHESVIAEQVGEEGLAELRQRAAAAGLDPDAARFLPVHPWQLSERVLALHAGDLARRDLAVLGPLDRRYRPQISIRTLTDADDPARRAIKLPLSILNTSVHRGLPRDATLAAPALSAWFGGLVDGDPFLREQGLVVLAEEASISVAHRAFERIAGVPYQHTEMLGALWRAPLEPRLRPGERAMTMAALLHRDPAGTALVEPLIARSGLTVGEWVARLHQVVLPPLLHVLYRFGATFSPHAQNCLLLLRDGVPARLAVKDVVDDATITSDPLPELRTMPAAVRRALGDGVESMIASQWIQSGLLVCVYRYVAEILADRLGYDEAAFWAAAERAVAGYQERFADELGDRFGLFDFEAPAFVKLCLNRVRIVGRGYADDPERPIAAASGFVPNPLAP
ncbi:IucA/IucC family protein [Patulibacter defluvii]|uniref:IucA/IucC family protein n=1 Tax=Patulibacter defluvii TaxID=3095358 RepID=UPI002A750AE3|nr:IucA/IucC family protein [Patulibacter sp. DM4]